MPILKLLLGGSPCTHWSIAQTKHRETEPSGIGWELFKNYLIAKEKYRPDYFLYENNKSMANAIREQITKELGVEPILINSALVSAQNRQRLYWTNIPSVTRPADRGILLRDVLDSGTPWQDKSYCITATEHKGTTLEHNLTRHVRTLVAEQNSGFGLRQVGRRINAQGHREDNNPDIESIQRFEINEDPQKSNCLTSVLKDSMVAVPLSGAMCVASRGRYTRADGGAEQHLEVQTSGKTNTLTTIQKDNLVVQPLEFRERRGGVAVDVDGYQFAPGENSGKNAVQFLGGFSKDGERWLEDGKAYSRNFNQGRRLHGVDKKSVTVTAQGCGLAGNTGLYAVPVRVGEMPTVDGEIINAQSKRIYSADGKARTLLAHAGGGNGNTSAPSTGLYAVPASIACRGRNGGHAYEVRGDRKSNAVIVGHESRMVIEAADGKTYPVYEVRSRKIMIRGKEFPIKLPDGFYIIRKLTVSECKRLQTVPEEYIFPVSNAQAYKLLGNGWTVEVIVHILSFCPGIRSEHIEVLSMYDGMSCGQIALNALGAKIVRYYATEIDKYAVQTTQANYPKTIQLGDAFQVRDNNWALPKCA